MAVLLFEKVTLEVKASLLECSWQAVHYSTNSFHPEKSTPAFAE